MFEFCHFERRMRSGLISNVEYRISNDEERMIVIKCIFKKCPVGAVPCGCPKLYCIAHGFNHGGMNGN